MCSECQQKLFRVSGIMGYFKFPFLFFCICVVSKFSTVNMFLFYNKDKIITTDLAKCCSYSLTGGPGPPSRAAWSSRAWPLGPQGPRQSWPPHPCGPGLGRAEAGFPPDEKTRNPFVMGGCITVSMATPLVLSSGHTWGPWGVPLEGGLRPGPAETGAGLSTAPTA